MLRDEHSNDSLLSTQVPLLVKYNKQNMLCTEVFNVHTHTHTPLDACVCDRQVSKLTCTCMYIVNQYVAFLLDIVDTYSVYVYSCTLLTHYHTLALYMYMFTCSYIYKY